MSADLKPCPFCGQSKTRSYRRTLGHDLLHAISCYCGAEVSEYSYAAAVKRWNTREPDYDALAAQRDEGLAREAELRAKIERQRTSNSEVLSLCGEACARHDAMGQRLSGAENLLRRWGEMFAGGIASSQLEVLRDDNSAFLASPGCADGEETR